MIVLFLTRACSFFAVFPEDLCTYGPSTTECNWRQDPERDGEVLRFFTLDLLLFSLPGLQYDEGSSERPFSKTPPKEDRLL